MQALYMIWVKMVKLGAHSLAIGGSAISAAWWHIGLFWAGNYTVRTSFVYFSGTGFTMVIPLLAIYLVPSYKRMRIAS